MRIACIDDESYALENFKYLCKDIDEIEEVVCFDNYIELLDHMRINGISLVFADINMPGISGLELIKYIKSIDENIEVVFVTGYDEYALEAFDVGAFGYILKPCSAEKIREILSKCRRMNIQRKQKRMEIKAFGRFDVFVDGKAIYFSNKKAKELLALLVDRRGGIVTMEQAIDALWEDRAFDDSTKTLYRIAAKNLRDTLAKEDCAHVLRESRGQRSLDMADVKCDYFDFINNPLENRELFDGEYMSDYSWGEFTLARILSLIDKY